MAFIGIATYATLVKVISDTIVEEIKLSNIRLLPIPPPPPPPTSPHEDKSNNEGIKT